MVNIGVLETIELETWTVRTCVEIRKPCGCFHGDVFGTFEPLTQFPCQDIQLMWMAYQEIGQPRESRPRGLAAGQHEDTSMAMHLVQGETAITPSGQDKVPNVRLVRPPSKAGVHTVSRKSKVAIFFVGDDARLEALEEVP